MYHRRLPHVPALLFQTDAKSRHRAGKATQAPIHPVGDCVQGLAGEQAKLHSVCIPVEGKMDPPWDALAAFMAWSARNVTARHTRDSSAAFRGRVPCTHR